jgi:hypothetical protein
MMADETKNEKHRVHLYLTREEYDRIETLRTRVRVDTRAQLVRRGLRLYEWCLTRNDEGYNVGYYRCDEKTGQWVLIELMRPNHRRPAKKRISYDLSFDFDEKSSAYLRRVQTKAQGSTAVAVIRNGLELYQSYVEHRAAGCVLGLYSKDGSPDEWTSIDITDLEQ